MSIIIFLAFYIYYRTEVISGKLSSYEEEITMLKKGLLASCLVLSLGVVGCSGDEENSKENVETENETTTVTEKGQEIYNQKCANCHGQNLEGIVGPSLTTAGAKYNEEELVHIIVNGIEKTTMPGGLLQGEEAEIVAQWLAQQK